MLKLYIFISTFVLTIIIGSAQQSNIPVSYSLSINSKPSKTSNSNYYQTYFSEHYLDENGKRIGYVFNHTKLDSAQISNLYASFIADLKRLKKIKNYHHTNLTDVPLTKLTKELIDSVLEKKGVEMFGDLFLFSNYNEMSWKKNMGMSKQGGVILGEKSILYKERQSKKTINYIPLHLDGMDFIETWGFDPSIGKFSKNILFSGIGSLSGPQEMDGQKLLLANKKNADITSESNLFLKNVSYDVLFGIEGNCEPSNAMSDCSDLYSTASIGNYTKPFLNITSKEKLIVSIFSAMNNRKIVPIRAETFKVGEIEEVLNKSIEADVYELFMRQDTATLYYDYPPYDTWDTVITSYKNIQDIIGIGFVEDWYIQKENFSFQKKVKYISLLFKVKDNYTLELKDQYLPFLYFKLND